MQKIFFKIMILLALVLFCLNGLAVDLLTVYRDALANDAQLKAAEFAFAADRENIDQAQAQKRLQAALSGEASLAYGDVIASDARTPDVDSVALNARVTAAISQNIYSRLINTSITQAQLGVAQSELNLAFERQNLLFRVPEAYFAVLAAQDSLRFAVAEKNAIARQLEQAKARFDVGLIAITDVREAQASFDAAVSQEIAAQNALDNAYEALAVLVNQRYDALHILGEITLAPPQPNVIEEWVDLAQAQNIGLLLRRKAIEAAQNNIQLQKAANSPTLDWRASYTLSGREQNRNPDTTFSRQDAAIALEFTLPFDSSGAIRSKVRQAAQQVEQSQQLYLQAERTTIQQTRNGFRGVNTAIARVQAAQQALISSQAALEATEAGFEVGIRTTVDVLDALRLVFAAQRDLANARYSYILNTFALKQAAGTLSEADLAAINALLVVPPKP
jgi:outer membrane protein